MSLKPCPSAEDLWTRFRAGLELFLRKRINAPEDAADVLQEIFLKIHQDRCRLEDGERVEGWVYRIARNAVVDFYRRQGRRRHFEPLDELELSWPAEVASDAHEEVLTWLRPTLDDLPSKYREALRLADFEGHSQAEVARQLGLTLSGAKSRIQRARQQLGDRISACCDLELGPDGRITSYQPKPAASCGSCASDPAPPREPSAQPFCGTEPLAGG